MIKKVLVLLSIIFLVGCTNKNTNSLTSYSINDDSISQEQSSEESTSQEEKSEDSSSNKNQIQSDQDSQDDQYSWGEII